MRNKIIELKIKVQSLEDLIQAKHINKKSIKQNSTSEKTAIDGANRQTDRQTDGHGDS